MKLHHYHGELDQRRELTPAASSDEETTSFEAGSVTGAEIEERIVSLYSDDQHWSVTMSLDEWNRIHEILILSRIREAIPYDRTEDYIEEFCDAIDDTGIYDLYDKMSIGEIVEDYRLYVENRK